MSKQIKILLVVGAVLIALAATYWLWPDGTVSERGVSVDSVAADEAE